MFYEIKYLERIKCMSNSVKSYIFFVISDLENIANGNAALEDNIEKILKNKSKTDCKIEQKFISIVLSEFSSNESLFCLFFIVREPTQKPVRL